MLHHQRTPPGGALTACQCSEADKLNSCFTGWRNQSLTLRTFVFESLQQSLNRGQVWTTSGVTKSNSTCCQRVGPGNICSQTSGTRLMMMNRWRWFHVTCLMLVNVSQTNDRISVVKTFVWLIMNFIFVVFECWMIDSWMIDSWMIDGEASWLTDSRRRRFSLMAPQQPRKPSRNSTPPTARTAYTPVNNSGLAATISLKPIGSSSTQTPPPSRREPPSWETGTVSLHWTRTRNLHQSLFVNDQGGKDQI